MKIDSLVQYRWVCQDHVIDVMTHEEYHVVIYVVELPCYEGEVVHLNFFVSGLS